MAQPSTSTDPVAQDPNTPAASAPKKRCYKCKEMIDKEAKKCPHCKTKQPTLLGVIVVVFMFVCIGFMIWAFSLGGSSDKDKSTRRSESSSVAWYEGGTLHNATIGRWRTATARDKLATAADFVCNAHNALDRDLPWSQVRPLAEELVQQIDYVAEDTPENEKVADIASMLYTIEEGMRQSGGQ